MDRSKDDYIAATHTLYGLARQVRERGDFDEEDLLAMLASATAAQAAVSRGPVGAIEYIRDLADTLEERIMPMPS